MSTSTTLECNIWLIDIFRYFIFRASPIAFLGYTFTTTRLLCIFVFIGLDKSCPSEKSYIWETCAHPPTIFTTVCDSGSLKCPLLEPNGKDNQQLSHWRLLVTLELLICAQSVCIALVKRLRCCPYCQVQK